MDSFQLNGKNIIVTGAASGIGRDMSGFLHETCAKCMPLGKSYSYAKECTVG